MLDEPKWQVTFTGHGPGDHTAAVPLLDLSQSPYVCSGPDGGPYLHWRQEGIPAQRRYRYAGLCADIPGPHTHPGAAATAE